MKTDKISFTSTPLTTVSTIYTALPRYRENLTAGILDTFEILAKNGVDDKVSLYIAHKPNAKKCSTDVLRIGYYPHNDWNEQSSVFLSPKKLEKLSKEDLSNFFLSTYEKLKKSTKNVMHSNAYSMAEVKELSENHTKLLEKLDNYSLDDLGMA